MEARYRVPKGLCGAWFLVLALLQEDAIVNVLKLSWEQQLYVSYSTNNSRLEVYIGLVYLLTRNRITFSIVGLLSKSGKISNPAQILAGAGLVKKPDFGMSRSRTPAQP